MCGIAGVYEFAGRGEAPAHRVRAMLDAIVHRGPDDDGMHEAPGLAFGTRRLAIIDPLGGHQPLTNEAGDVVVACNGEIYNYRQLASALRARGHVLHTGCDTEVIAHLYEERGEDCLHELDGMFALAIWDGRRRRLLIARDRLGIKPLYYAEEDGRLLFGSEIKALLPYRSAPVRPSMPALAAFMLLKYVPAPATMFDGVQALAPGHLLACDSAGISLRRWWDLSFAPAAAPVEEREAADRLRELLEDAVRSHLVSDVPFGAFLSGGVDSSTVVALMSRALGRPVKTFAVGYEGAGAELSELSHARVVAEHCQTDHHECLLGAQDFVAHARDVVWHLDQPIADNACLANYLVARLAAGHVKMVLTGEGGDELFAGYARYAGERASPVLSRLPGPLRSAVRRIGASGPGLSRPKIALYALSHRDESERFAHWFPLMHPEARAELSVGALAQALPGASPGDLFAGHLRRTDAAESINRMLYVDTKLWLPDDLLARGDKMSMAASLEARVPLLDHRLVEFAAGLPARMKVRGLHRKYLLKQVARELLPGEIIDRRKQGFPVPMAAWLRDGAREFARDLLCADTVRRRGLFDPRVLGRMLDEHDRQKADHSAQLWALISVELWHQLYVEDRGRPSSARSSAEIPPDRIAVAR